MRKSEETNGGRLSSSCSSIRSSNYRESRPYTSSLASYRYSASSYTPSSRMNSTESTSTSGIGSLSRSRYGSSTGSGATSSLSRGSSTSTKNLYTSPAAARSSSYYSESATPYRGISKYSVTQAATEPPKPSYDREKERGRYEKKEPPRETSNYTSASNHLRSRSTSYRTISVSQLTQQARDRADRDEKDRQYKEWLEKETNRENKLPTVSLEPTVTESAKQEEFKRAMTSSISANSLRTSHAGYTPRVRYERKTSPRATLDRSPMQENHVMSTSYSSTNANLPPPPSYTKSPPDPSYTKSPPPAPPPMPTPPTISSPSPVSSVRIPRSASAAVLTSTPNLANSSYVKSTAKVHPYDDREERGSAVKIGYTGLRNIGNTCFMNAVLQMLVNNVELREFFLKDHYKMEVNEKNPLGFGGRLARAFAEFMKQMWSGQHKAIEPVRIKELVAEKASQFANFAQHDSHEFLSFLLDGLHEDVNRVKSKPLTNTVESDGRNDIDVSNEAWRNHLLRNDSIFVDLFHGQLKSRVQCPSCDRISITFDPFVYLPVPFPKRKKSSTIFFWPLETTSKPRKLTVSYANEGTVGDLLTAVEDTVKVPTRNLRAIQVFGHRIEKVLTNDVKVSEIGSCDVIYVFEIHDEHDCKEEVIVLNVLQRQLYPGNLRYMCNECGSNEGKLKACDACYNAYFCSRECQVPNWTSSGHKDECKRRPMGEPVGQPLIVSFPKSQLTYTNLSKVLEAKTSNTVTIFQQPQHQGGQNDEEISLTPPTLAMKKRNGAPPSLFNPSMDTKPRRTAEPKKSVSSKLFNLRSLTKATDSFGENLATEKSEDILDLKSGGYVLLSWMNLKFGKEFLSVCNKPTLDIDIEKSDKNATTNGNRNDSIPTLTEMLSLFSETERLKPEESWYCSNCKTHVEATKKLELFRLPPVLIVQLKRFVYTAFTYTSSMHRRSKDERTVDYPLEKLDMSQFLSQTAPEHISTMYDLTGIVCHSGTSHFGHYISMGRLPDFDAAKTKIDWRNFDDSMVTTCPASNVQNNDDAYLLFYKMRGGKPTQSIFRKHYSCDPSQDRSSREKSKDKSDRD